MKSICGSARNLLKNFLDYKFRKCTCETFHFFFEPFVEEFSLRRDQNARSLEEVFALFSLEITMWSRFPSLAAPVMFLQVAETTEDGMRMEASTGTSPTGHLLPPEC